jgi:hypothetical protein
MKLSALPLGIVLTFGQYASSQVPAAREDRDVPPAANAWMRVPFSLAASREEVPPYLRSQRDQYFDNGLVGESSPLTPETAGRKAISEGATFGPQPEIPAIDHRTIVIGTFISHQAVLTASGRAIYSGVIFRLSHVFENAGGRAAPGANLTLIFPGGTVRTADGRDMSFLTHPRAYFVQPGKTYLLVLEYHADGDFYILGKSWDLSDGTVRANSGIDRKRETEGRSTLLGLSQDQLIRVLNERFAVSR